MTPPTRITRRALLRAAAAGSVALGLAACGAAPNLSPAASKASPTPTPIPPSPSPTPVPSPSAAPSATPPPSTSPAALRSKIARLLVVGFRGLELSPDDPLTAALAGGLGGVILFDRDQSTGGRRNITSPRQLAALTGSLRAAASGPLLIAIDQEGGKVSRLNPAMGFPATRTQAEIGATGDPDMALAAGRAMGKTLAAAGIDLDLAPVVDVNVNPKNPAIGALGRSFSADPAVVATMAEAEIRGLHESGVRATLKHFPGLGSAAANTDFAVVDVTKTWTDRELGPFKALIDAGLPDAVMSGNILNRTLDAKTPASLSSATIDGLLRGQLGWTGVVVTDDLGAVAITSRFKRAEAVALALEAGNDLLLFANQATYVPDLATDLVDTIVDLVTSGRVSESRLDASVARIDRLAAATSG